MHGWVLCKYTRRWECVWRRLCLLLSLALKGAEWVTWNWSLDALTVCNLDMCCCYGNQSGDRAQNNATQHKALVTFRFSVLRLIVMCVFKMCCPEIGIHHKQNEKRQITLNTMRAQLARELDQQITGRTGIDSKNTQHSVKHPETWISKSVL